MLIGIDAPIPERVYEWARQGELPAIAALIKNGVYAKNCLPPFPTITPPNWTSIVTGAWAGTHGVTHFNVHYPGDPLDVTHQGFTSDDCLVETMWEAAEREGHKSIIVNYPTSWPPRVETGIQLGGGGITVLERRVDVPYARPGHAVPLADDQLFTTSDQYPLANTITLQPADGWSGVSCSQDDLEAVLPLTYRHAAQPLAAVSWHVLLQATRDQGYDRVLIAESKALEAALADLRPGEWSPVIRRVFETDEGPREAAFRCKVVELSPDGERFRLYVTALCAVDGYAAYPPAVAGEIRSEEGLPLPRGGYIPFTLGWIDAETFLDLVEFEAIWMTDACTYLLKNKEWDLFFVQEHAPDFAYHTFSSKLDPLTAESDEEVATYQALELAIYKIVDRFVGRLLEVADEETVVAIVSDHGAKPLTPGFSADRVLEEVGLTVYYPEEDELGRRSIDWSRTRALVQPHRSCHIYVNLKGRDPQGIVEPGEEYERVRDDVIRALYDYTDPEKGVKPVILALKREDARIIGLHGNRVGDVVWALDPRFGAEHGPYLGTARYGIGSLRSLFIVAGPGVKQGYEMDRTMWLPDVAPTLCTLADLPVPEDTEGAIIYQLLEDPNAKLRELQQLRESYDRLKRAWESTQSLTHGY
jgi:predicted AlkP superfamily phosphohydrolase/phosphomutase